MISVCMPVYNGSKYIKEQMDSILCQLGSDDEVVVSDDSSTDNTIEILRSYNDSRIKILENNTFHSVIYNLENALKHAKGDYIFLSDQDDVWISGKVKECVELLLKFDCVVTDAQVVDSDLNIIFPSFMKLNHSRKGFWWNIIKNGFIGCCMCFTHDMKEKCLPFPHDIAMHDIWLGLVMSKYGKVYFYR